MTGMKWWVILIMKLLINNMFSIFQNDLTRLITSGKKPVKMMAYYNQGDSKLCTFFSSATNICYNTGLYIHDSDVRTLGKDHTIASSEQTSQKMAEHFKLKAYKVDVKDWIKRGTQWSIIVSLSVEPKFYLDGMDGKVEELHKAKIGWHSVCLRREDKKILLVNSWGNRKGKQEYDITEVIMGMLANGSLKDKGIIIA